MAVRAIVPGRTKDHVYSGDVRPKEGEPGYEDFQPTVWPLKGLDSRLIGLLKDRSAKVTIDASKPNDEIGTVFNQNEYAFQVVALGLDKPRNFLDAKGDEIKWATAKRNLGGKSYEIVADEVLAQVPGPVIAELAEEIEKMNSVTAEEGNG